MNLLGLYLVIQLWANSIGLITINNANSLINKKIKEKGYCYVKNNSVYPINETLIRVLKAFIPLYYCVEGLKLIKETNKTTIDSIIKKKLANGEIKEFNEDDLKNTLFTDKGINYNKKKFIEHVPTEPYRSIPFNERHTVEGDIIFQTVKDNDLGKYNGITPFVVEEKKESHIDIKKLSDILDSDEKFEDFIFKTPISDLENAYDILGKVLEIRTQREKIKAQKLELKKEDKAA